MHFISSLKNIVELKKLSSVIIDQGFMSITTLLTTVILARTYVKDGYAELVLLFSIALFTLGFQSAIISKPYAINLNDFRADTSRSYFQFNLGLKLLFTIAFIVVFPLISYTIFSSWDPYRFVFFLLYITAHSSYFFVRETLLSERKTKENMIYGIICSLSILSLLAVIFLFQLKDVRIFLGIASIIYLSLAFFFVVRNLRSLSFSNKISKTYWRSNWKVGKWLLGSNILFYLSTNIYPWLLLYFSEKEDIATFGVLMSVAGLVNPILTALSSYLLPLFVKMNTNYGHLHHLVRRWVFLFSVLALLLVCAGFLFGQDIIRILFGSKYAGLGFLAIFPFIVQALYVVFQPFKIALNAVRRTDVNFWILIPRSILAVTLGYFFIVRFGLPGVFYTMIIEHVVYQGLYFFAYRKHIVHNEYVTT